MTLDPARWKPLARRAAIGLGIHDRELDDAVGDALLALASKPPDCAEIAYLQARSAIVDYMRRTFGKHGTRRNAAIHSRRSIEAVELTDPADQLAGVELLAVIRRARLSLVELEAVAGYLAGIGATEQAAKLGITPSAIHLRIAAARAKLRSAGYRP